MDNIVENKWALHHSRKIHDRYPQGAVKTNTPITLRINIDISSKIAHCLVEVFFQNLPSRVYEMRNTGRVGYTFVFEATFTVPEEAGLLYYRFILNDRQHLYYYGGSSGEGRISQDSNMESYQVTLYDGNFDTPNWFKQAVVYQIFVDRFARSSARGGLNRANYHTDLGRKIVVHEDWNEKPMFAPLPGDMYYNPCDFYGGDLQGIIQKLPYLHGLGVTCLYLNPIFESCSNHKYNTSDYLKIDPMFGTEQDFIELCNKAEEVGISVLLDGVFSHTGDDSIYFNRYGHYQSIGAFQSPNSPYFDWYQFSHFPYQYRSWWGFDTLPEVNKSNENYRKFIYKNDDAVIKYWIQKGARGWRLDVADELSDDFIREMRTNLKKQDKEAVLLGEVWEDASNKFSNNEKRQYVMGKELDSVMNYPLREIILNFLLYRMDAFAAAESWAVLCEHYPMPFLYACLNLLSSHDVPRVISLLGGGPDKDSKISRQQQSEFALTDAQYDLAKQRFVIATTLQMTLPGAPCVYYGDEAGVQGLMDPFNRGSYPWEAADQHNVQMVKNLARLRKSSQILQTGYTIVFPGNVDCLCVLRFATEEKDAFRGPCKEGNMLVLTNRSANETKVNLDFNQDFEGPHALYLPNMDGIYADLCSNYVFSIENNKCSLVLPAYACLICQK